MMCVCVCVQFGCACVARGRVCSLWCTVQSRWHYLFMPLLLFFPPWVINSWRSILGISWQIQTRSITTWLNETHSTCTFKRRGLSIWLPSCLLFTGPSCFQSPPSSPFHWISSYLLLGCHDAVCVYVLVIIPAAAVASWGWSLSVSFPPASLCTITAHSHLHPVHRLKYPVQQSCHFPFAPCLLLYTVCFMPWRFQPVACTSYLCCGKRRVGCGDCGVSWW